VGGLLQPAWLGKIRRKLHNLRLLSQEGDTGMECVSGILIRGLPREMVFILSALGH